MKVNIDKMSCNISCFEELAPLEYFKQFNIYKNIDIHNKNAQLCRIENTIPEIKLLSTKIIGTKKGTSLEGQYLSGNKLIIVGNINVNLILNYIVKNRRFKHKSKKNMLNVDIPFSTFIVIPTDICNQQKVDIRYLIEDITVVKICMNKLFISVTILLQYLDQY